MRQLPGKKDEAVIRVQMDEAELHRLLDPILKEVNSLRARVLTLETQLERLVDGVAATLPVLETLVADYAVRQDDGK